MSISKDDQDFWLEAVQDVQPPIPRKYVEKTGKKLHIAIREKQHFASKQEFTTYSKALEDDAFGGIDKATLRRFKREEFKVEAVLDLHGLTEDEAFVQVDNFIPQCYAEKKRCVIIITGKGGLHQQEDIFAPRGILKCSVPQWLNMPRLRAMILLFKNPSERLGGKGALYILLKRNKEL